MTTIKPRRSAAKREERKRAGSDGTRPNGLTVREVAAGASTRYPGGRSGPQASAPGGSVHFAAAAVTFFAATVTSAVAFFIAAVASSDMSLPAASISSTVSICTFFATSA
jgi:hypothetical protein